MEKNLPTLPSSWVWTEVGNVCDVQTGPFGTQLHKSDYTTSGINTIEIGDVHPNRNLAEGTAHFVSQEKANELTRYEVKEGDILFTRVGTVGRCTRVPSICTGWLMSTSLIRVRPRFRDPSLSSFLLYYFWSPTSQSFSKATSKGTTRAGTNYKIVEKLPLALAPINEQKRIISKVEELFSFLDAGTESLRKVQTQLKRYRQAILKNAVEGKLTKEWRQMCKEPEWSCVILSSIAKVSVGHVGPVSIYYTTPDKGISMLSTANISDNGLVKLDKINYVNREFAEKNKSKKIYPGDLIVARHGDSGRAARIPDGFKEAFCLNAVIVRPSGVILPHFLEAVFRFHGNRDSLLTKKSGSVQSIVGTTALKQFTVPLPSLPEQKEIIERLEAAISIVRETEIMVEESLIQSEKIRQSILKTAFEGKLVPQGPADEPADKILNRIKCERVSNKNTKFNDQWELSNYVK